MASINDYIEDAKVIKEINDLNDFFKEKPLKVSDIIDNEGFQYVDLVQEGGGVLGIALLGYTYALEEMGIRFYSLAGTSAGAINTALLAGVAKPNEKKSVKILTVLDQTNLFNFIDGGKDAEDFVKSLSSGGKPETFLNSLRFADDILIRKELGLNRGKVFFDWLIEAFEKFSIKTTEDLIKKMNEFPIELLAKNIKANLAIIASDITTQTKASFPDMGDLYYKTPLTINPANYVRASMSIPAFFDPFIIKDIPKGKEQVEKWQNIDKAYFFGNIPDEITLVDGGVMSNFPIDIFHVKNKKPSKPTFGVKLGIDRESVNNNDSILKIFMNSFSAARQMRDHDVILKNQDYINLISNIDDRGIDWLNFNLPDKDKIELFKRGVIAACAFLRNFDWDDYKKIRSNLLKSCQAINLNSRQQNYSKAFILKN